MLNENEEDNDSLIIKDQKSARKRDIVEILLHPGNTDRTNWKTNAKEHLENRELE